MRKLSDEEILRAKALRQEGRYLVDIAREFNVHFTTIALWTGSDEYRKRKLTYKPQNREIVQKCTNCEARIFTSEKYCDCRFPSLVKRYFFSPNDI